MSPPGRPKGEYRSAQREGSRLNPRALLLALWVAAGAAGAAEPPREAHGSADAFAAPGVALAWGVLRDTNESATTVVVRVVTDPAVYPWLAVAGIDPFTKAEQPVQCAVMSGGTLDLRIPRAQFADYPRTELRLFTSAAAAQGGPPALVVFYHGVPDTTPEFTDATRLEADLAARIAQARSTGAKEP